MKIDCITKRPGGKLVHTSVLNTLENLQKNVGGFIEVVSFVPAAKINGVNLVILCDEDGKLKGKPTNINLFGSEIVGDIIICGLNRTGEFVDMPLEYREIKALIEKAI